MTNSSTHSPYHRFPYQNPVCTSDFLSVAETEIYLQTVRKFSYTISSAEILNVQC